jgi:hypothetical protein
MGLTAIMSAASMALRLLEEAPALVSSVEEFWQAVTGHTAAPPHVTAAVDAAIASVKSSRPSAEG